MAIRAPAPVDHAFKSNQRKKKKGPPQGKNGELYPVCSVVFPNEHVYPDSEGFWKQGEIDMFMCENWSQYSPQDVQKAIGKQNEYIEKKNKFKEITKLISAYSQNSGESTGAMNYSTLFQEFEK